MNIIKDSREYGLLSEFVYLRLEDKGFEEHYGDIHNKEIVKQFIKGLKGKDTLLIGEKGEKRHPITDEELEEMTDIKPERREAMLSVLDKYDIKEFSSDDGYFSSGFQGMLLQNKETGQFVVAFRGTAGKKDIMIDAGIAGNHNFQYNEAVEFTKDCMEKYNIKKDDLVLTGHSLGGILVQMVGSELKIPGYAFNPLGSQNLVHPLFPKAYRLLEEFGFYESEESKFAKNNIINISYTDTGAINGDVLSNFATNVIGSKHMGQVVNLLGRNLGLDAHSIIPTNILLERLDKENISSIEELIEYNKKVIELEKQNSHEQKQKDWQSMTPEQKATAINNGYGLGLSSNTKGIDNLESVSKSLVEKFEENKEEKINNIELAINNINSQSELEAKIQVLKDTNIASNVDNIYSKQFIEQYQEKVITNNANSLSSSDLLSINIESQNSNLNEETKYQSFSPNNSNQTTNSSTQAMS